MAVCRKFGYPNLFITFTCNAKWPGILEGLKMIEGQKAQDRPDIIARVFRIRLKLFMDKLIKKDISVLWLLKYGLPHAHILLWLDSQHKCRSQADVDRIISAEMPDPIATLIAHKVVLEFMIHGPCGSMKPNAPCMSKLRCLKHYPKKFQSQTYPRGWILDISKERFWNIFLG
ncbi:hypothetical protein PTKIN_Ptkin08bG0086600 [Pterospermum kingtungense]